MAGSSRRQIALGLVGRRVVERRVAELEVIVEIAAVWKIGFESRGSSAAGWVVERGTVTRRVAVLPIRSHEEAVH